jgi:hypothetical protein
MKHPESELTNAEIREVWKGGAQVAFAAFLRPAKIVGDFKTPLHPGDIVKIAGDINALQIVNLAEPGAQVSFDESDLPFVGGGRPPEQRIQQILFPQYD